ncbi:glycoside hydrolase family 75 protein [Sorangium sp. So ce118]
MTTSMLKQTLLLAVFLPACSASQADGRRGDGDLADAALAASAPTGAELLSAVSTCRQVSQGHYATDEDEEERIAICGLNGAVFWQADMDIDCDGKETVQCNSETDPSFQPQTSATDSQGEYLDAARLPYVVVPLPSDRFDYENAGLSLGSVIAVIYQGRVNYGVFGDEGPEGIIGEASYAMGKSLGIDPDPATGGVDSGVTYIAFTGDDAVAQRIEDHREAVEIGEQRAAQLLQENSRR